MDGIISLIKPPGMTSHDIIHWIRRTLEVKKAGHTGTLDPGAAGVLPVCIGKATKIIPYMDEDIKIYRAKINFGITTDTQDKYGLVINKVDPRFSLYDLESTLDTFTGKLVQKPSIYSAIKVRGKKLYEYAREGKEVEIPTREVAIHYIKLIHYNLPYEAFIEVKCSKGTYIRTLCHDIGISLGCGAHMGTLVRIRNGCFDIQFSYTLEEIEKSIHQPKKFILPMDFPLESYPKINIRKNAGRSLKSGNVIYPQGIINDLNAYSENTIVTAYIENSLSAIGVIKWDYQNKRFYLKPLRVL